MADTLPQTSHHGYRPVTNARPGVSGELPDATRLDGQEPSGRRSDA